MREGSNHQFQTGTVVRIAFVATWLAIASALGGCAAGGNVADSYAMATPASGGANAKSRKAKSARGRTLSLTNKKCFFFTK